MLNRKASETTLFQWIDPDIAQPQSHSKSGQDKCVKFKEKHKEESTGTPGKNNEEKGPGRGFWEGSLSWEWRDMIQVNISGRLTWGGRLSEVLESHRIQRTATGCYIIQRMATGACYHGELRSVDELPIELEPEKL